MERVTDYRRECSSNPYSILARIIDFTGLVPDITIRCASALEDNPPRFYRLLQLEALLGAYGLKPDSAPFPEQILDQLRRTQRQWRDNQGEWQTETGLGYVMRQTPLEFFLEGQFILRREPADYRHVILMLKPHWSEDIKPGQDTPAYNIFDVQNLWERLIHFRLEAERIANYNGGVLEASRWYSCAINATETVCSALRGQLKEIDDILARLIDPKLRVMSREELIARHGFPNVDLFDIDCDWD